jgi:hypothetical protein
MYENIIMKGKGMKRVIEREFNQSTIYVCLEIP